MAKKGVQLLPPVISAQQMIDIYKILAKVNLQIGTMKSDFSHSIVASPLVSIFSLNESVQSTKIEGTQVTFLEMIEPSNRKGWEQQEVLNYKKALDLGVDLIKGGMPFSTRLIQKLHKVLMTNARGTSSAGGEYRKIQNFIGPDNNIEHAIYIPVTAAEIPQYMENLEYFMNGEVHSSFKKYNGSEGVVLDEKIEPLIKIAIMHAQFESIHPFCDGNGRLGRILIALMAMSYDLVDFPVFLVSEELEKERARYYALLNGIRGDNPDWYLWIKFFLECCERMASKLIDKMKNAEQLAKEGLSKCRLDTEKKVWMYTFQKPYCKVSDFDSSIGSTITVRKALNSLSDKGLLFVDKEVKRNRIYRNYDLLRILQN